MIGGTPSCRSLSCNVPPYLGVSEGASLCKGDNLWLQDGESQPTVDPSNVLGCKSNCSVYNTPMACCTGDFQDRTLCPNSNPAFLSVCPSVYTYAYADSTAVTCQLGSNNATLQVAFCPPP